MKSNLDNFIRAEVKDGRMVYWFRCSDCGCEYKKWNLQNITGVCSQCQAKRCAEKRKKRIENESKKALANALPMIRKRIRKISEKVYVNDKKYILESEVLRIIDEMEAADDREKTEDI